MLAHRFADHSEKIQYPVVLQPKLNGIRMMYSNGVMQSRSHNLEEPKTWPEHRLLHLREALARIPPWVILDGELYIHGQSLQKINSIAGVNNSADTDRTHTLQYHVFDGVSTNETKLSFIDRWNLLLVLNRLFTKPLHLVSTLTVGSPQLCEIYHSQFKSQGFEGSMYRELNASYGFEEECGNKQNRWTRILKRKDWLDIDLPILSWSFGTGKYSDCLGSLDFEMPDGARFSAGSGLSDMERQTLMTDYEGKWAKIKYEMLSDDGTPLKPTIECIL